MSIEELVIQSLMSYAITFVIASSSIFDSVRTFIIAKTPSLKIKNHKHFIECRMCVSFWISLAVVALHGDYKYFLAVYGLSYFIATQER